MRFLIVGSGATGKCAGRLAHVDANGRRLYLIEQDDGMLYAVPEYMLREAA